MDGQAITTRSDVERILLDERIEAKALPLSLLNSITNNFSHEIGRGGFAVVYKGLLDHREVAVKRLSQNTIDENEFIREVQCLMKAKHKNIVRFLGYCSDRQGQIIKYNGEFVMGDVCQRLLCFEYVPNGSLDKYIENASREWEKSYGIIKGVCEGLHYLHKERIVHLDLKPANILLDNDTVPKIADFGISRCFGQLQTHVVTSKLIGSLGYLAPESFSNGKITFDRDIYSLGVIIVEILTGDKGHPKVEQVQEHWRHKLDGSHKELQLEQIRVCTEVAQSCLQHDPEKRPSAQTIIDLLKKNESEEWFPMLPEESMEAKPLSLSLLKSITNNFSHEIGRGNFAVVYKGQLEYGEVAVKQLPQNSIDEKEFTRKVQCLMKAKHRNIVRFLGYCSDRQGQMVKYNGEFVLGDVCQRLLCFEYVPNGSLNEYIKDASREWGKCYEIIKGVCEGLHYLHKERIVHEDLKPTNILLDNDMVPKITDFGISRCFGELQTHVVTSKVSRSLGYLAPELFFNGKTTFEADIYSLGVIITEMLTGDKGHHPNVEKIQEHWSHKLEGSHKELQLDRIRVCTEVAQSCLQEDPEKRPSVETIIDILEQNEGEEWFPMLLDESMEAMPLPFSLLKCITNNFSHQIGRGDFAVVYKGQLEHREVAVKKLSQSHLDANTFIKQIQCLMKVKHKNIVRFLGYCSDTQREMVAHNGKFVMADVCQRWLCFEYVPNGSLNEYIKDASHGWRKCYKIIKGVCEGLHYLHKKRIVHLDFTPANILLDNYMVPKITDFGISRCFDELQTLGASKFAGTLGYLAPELFHNRIISFKSDIYSLGIIIIEILTGDKGYPKVGKVQEYWSQKLNGLHKELLLEQIRVCTLVAQTCLAYTPDDRPIMQEIIDILEQTERYEWHIDTVASSHKFRPPIWDPKIRATMLTTCKQAILKIYAQDTNDMSMDEVYRDGYHLVLHEKGEELYSVVETAMNSEVQSLCRPLDDSAAAADSALFLQELLTRWDRHSIAFQFIRNIFVYMDHTFVPTNGKTPIKELGLSLWRDEMARSSKIRQSLIEAVKRQKGGEDELVPGVNKMLSELGADVKNMPCLCFQDSRGLHIVAGP